jgi:hypothetical protein
MRRETNLRARYKDRSAAPGVEGKDVARVAGQRLQGPHSHMADFCLCVLLLTGGLLFMWRTFAAVFCF